MQGYGPREIGKEGGCVTKMLFAHTFYHIDLKFSDSNMPVSAMYMKV